MFRTLNRFVVYLCHDAAWTCPRFWCFPPVSLLTYPTRRLRAHLFATRTRKRKRQVVSWSVAAKYGRVSGDTLVVYQSGSSSRM